MDFSWGKFAYDAGIALLTGYVSAYVFEKIYTKRLKRVQKQTAEETSKYVRETLKQALQDNDGVKRLNAFMDEQIEKQKKQG
jgi:hypothetical protein